MLQLHCGDCLEVLSELPPASVDMVFTDPPYGTTQSKWDSVIPLDVMWGKVLRVAKRQAPMVFCAGQPFTSALIMSQPKLFAYTWVWVKSKITGVLNAKRMPVRKHEDIVVFSERPSTWVYNAQGLRRVDKMTSQGSSSDNYGSRDAEEYLQEFTGWPRDVLEIKSAGKTVHPTQKPEALAEYMIKTYTNPGATVLDFCMGSGTFGAAAVKLGRRFIGIEKDPKYFNLASERIRNCYIPALY